MKTFHSNLHFFVSFSEEYVGCAKIPSWMKTTSQEPTGISRITQGQTAPEPIPWQVHLRQGSPTGSFLHFCGGTIIDAKTILTAAHCYHGKNLDRNDYFVYAGAVHLFDRAHTAQIAFVESITLHESFNYNRLENDVAILKLKTPLTFNYKVQPACLPDASFKPSGNGVASGWGLKRQYPEEISPEDLQVCRCYKLFSTGPPMLVCLYQR